MIEFDEPIGDLLDGLRDPDAPLRAALIYRLSDPVPDDLDAVRAAWGDVPVERRQLLLSRLAEISETSFELDFSDVALFALEDEDADVRRLAIETLWENELPTTMFRLIRILQHDEAAGVRAAAAQGLGRFVLAGELDTLPSATTREAEAALLEAWAESGEAMEVRRRALESVSYSGRDEVQSLILEALEDNDLRMQASAIFAMGRSADEQWEGYVQEALNNPEPELRYEAARAAGELFLVAAVPRLIDMLDEGDREIRHAAIWSLGEIGGAAAQRALLLLADRETDEDILEAVEDAINSAALSTGEFAAYLIGPDVAQPPDLDDFDDLADLDDWDEDAE